MKESCGVQAGANVVPADLLFTMQNVRSDDANLRSHADLPARSAVPAQGLLFGCLTDRGPLDMPDIVYAPENEFEPCFDQIGGECGASSRWRPRCLRCWQRPARSDNDNSGSGLIFRALLLMAVSIAASQNFSAKSLSQNNCT
jgi:hypothetical protein